MARRPSRTHGDGDASGPDPRIASLYALPPADFVPARDALARALQAEGSAEATGVRRLRRPTLPAWLANAAVRERPDLLQALLAAGDELRDAQARALGGRDADLRAASSGLRDAIGATLDAARGVAVRVGRELEPRTAGELEQALRAVATGDAQARAALERGVLERLPAPRGIDLLAAPGPRTDAPSSEAAASPRNAPRASGPRAPAQAAAGDARGVDLARDEAARARRAEERELRRLAARRAEAELTARLRDRAASEARVREAERRLDVAERALRDAQRTVDALRRELEGARRDAEAAGSSAQAARARADGARRGEGGAPS